MKLYLKLFIIIIFSSGIVFTDWNNCASTGRIYQWWCWKLNSTSGSWQQAWNACIADGGTLANIYSREHWSALMGYIGYSGYPFVALTSTSNSSLSTMYWMSGYTVPTLHSPYNLLSQNLPDNTSMQLIGGGCATSPCCWYLQQFTGFSALKAWSCTGPRPFVCEYVNCDRTSGFHQIPTNGYLNVGSPALMTTSSNITANANACSALCMVTKFCVSFSFNLPIGTCRLYATKYSQSPSAFVANTSYVHYDMT